MLLTLGQDDDGRRLDRILRKYLSDVPLSSLHRLLRTGKIRVDGKKAQASDRVHAGSELSLKEVQSNAASSSNENKQESDSQIHIESKNAEKKLSIIYETENLLLVCKPQGVLIHGERSLDEQVQAYLKPKTGPSLSFRVGPLHRLDRQTSGLVAFSCTLLGAQVFSLALQERRIRKRYLGIFEGNIKTEEIWEDTLYRQEDQKITHLDQQADVIGKAALTRYVPLANNKNLSLGLVEIGTGRTHQIRAQAASRAHPLFGDIKYGGQKQVGGFLLHAYELNTEAAPELNLQENMIAPAPDHFLDSIEQLFSSEIATILRRALPTDTLRNAIL